MTTQHTEQIEREELIHSAFKRWSEKRDVWPRLTHEEIFTAGFSAALLAESDHNAPWLTEAHMLCTDHGIPHGNITERIKALREKLAENKAGGEPVKLQVNGVPPFKSPPADVIDAAFHVSDWAERNGLRNWRIGHCCSEDYTHPQPQAVPLTDGQIDDLLR